MIATMAVIAPFAEEKNESGIAAITWKPLSSDRSDRSDHMETKLKWASKYPNRLRSVYIAQTKIVTLMRRKLMRVRKPLSSSRNGA